MEGAVYRLGDEVVAKVWKDKSQEELRLLQQFYADLADAGLPFATPSITSVYQLDGASVTHEVALVGRPLQEVLGDSDTTAPPAAIACVSGVLQALVTTHGESGARNLAVLDEASAFRDDATWPDALLGLLSRRTAVFGDQFRAAVPNFDTTYARVQHAVRTVASDASSVIHGDLCGVNILVDDNLDPLAVLDWGFMSTAGDPMFDAAVTAGIFNMYGPHAGAIDQQLLDHFEAELGYPREAMLVYRAAYAIATSNAYDVDGKDGHFAWCAATLSRPDVLAVLEITGD